MSQNGMQRGIKAGDQVEIHIKGPRGGTAPVLVDVVGSNGSNVLVKMAGGDVVGWEAGQCTLKVKREDRACLNGHTPSGEAPAWAPEF